MRAKISLHGSGWIPFNYNLALAGVIYGSIKRANPDLGYLLHSSRDFKFFTFSELKIPKREISEKGIFIKDMAYFLVSSPKHEIISSFISGLLERPEVKISRMKLNVDNVEILKTPKFNERTTFSTLSPIVVKTAKKENGRLKTIELYPTEEKFYENLRKNLIRKYEMLYNEKKENISFSRPLSTKPKRIQIKNTFHKAVHMVFEAEGDSELLKLAYETGLGEKNSMGFGMVKVV